MNMRLGMYLLKFIMCGYSELPGFGWRFSFYIRMVCDYHLLRHYLAISNFLDEISSLPHSVVFLYFFALIAEEGFLISLLAILWNSAFKWYIFPFLLCL